MKIKLLEVIQRYLFKQINSNKAVYYVCTIYSVFFLLNKNYFAEA